MRYLAPYLAGSCAAASLLTIWGTLVEPRLIDQREERGEVPGLPAAWDGQRLALLADPQVGSRLANTGTARRIVERVLADRPALALIAGDLVYNAARNPRRTIESAVGLVRPLPAAGIPTYAVLGNHDYAEESTMASHDRQQIASELRRSLEAVGVRVLQNEVVALPAPGSAAPAPAGRSLFLVGLGPHRLNLDRPLAALAQLPAEAPRLVLMHNPDPFARLPAGAAPLALAGHTHGGQIRFPGRPAWAPARLFKPWPQYVDGWIEGFGQPGNRLYVNRGIGFTRIPVRIGCPPELTFFTLRRPLT